jgi:hypothetical protein
MIAHGTPIAMDTLEQDDHYFAQSKGFRAVSENCNLTDALEQQGSH